MDNYDISIVLGSKNRKRLLKETLTSVRNNGFLGSYEIIVIDGGSNDGTCEWLASQTDVLTIIQPNSRIQNEAGTSVLKHSWGEFMNIGFKYAKAPWIVMISDDLILSKGTLQKGYDILMNSNNDGVKIGGGAFFYREYPRFSHYRINLLPKDLVLINHGFYNKEALVDVNYIEENQFNFYCADSDLIMRFDEKGWKIMPLEGCYADHLVHKPNLRRKSKKSLSYIRDVNTFESKYPYPVLKESIINIVEVETNLIAFWKASFFNCLFWKCVNFYMTHIKRNKTLVK